VRLGDCRRVTEANSSQDVNDLVFDGTVKSVEQILQRFQGCHPHDFNVASDISDQNLN
jgi:hypothetical protein